MELTDKFTLVQKKKGLKSRHSFVFTTHISLELVEDPLSNQLSSTYLSFCAVKLQQLLLLSSSTLALGGPPLNILPPSCHPIKPLVSTIVYSSGSNFLTSHISENMQYFVILWLWLIKSGSQNGNMQS